MGSIFDESNLSEGEKTIRKARNEYDFERMLVS